MFMASTLVATVAPRALVAVVDLEGSVTKSVARRGTHCMSTTHYEQRQHKSNPRTKKGEHGWAAMRALERQLALCELAENVTTLRQRQHVAKLDGTTACLCVNQTKPKW